MRCSLRDGKWYYVLGLLLLGIIFHWVKLGKIDDFPDNERKAILSSVGFIIRDGRYFLPGGGRKGELIIRYTSSTIFRGGELYLTFYSDKGVKNRVDISTDGRHWTIIGQNISYDDNKLPLTKYINGSQRFYLRLTAHNNYPDRQKVIEQLDFFLTSRSVVYIFRNLFYLALSCILTFFLLGLRPFPFQKSLLLTLLLMFIITFIVLIEPASLDFAPELLLFLFSLNLFIINKKGIKTPLYLYILSLISIGTFLSTTDFMINQRYLFLLSIPVGVLAIALNYLKIKYKYELLLIIIMIFGIYVRASSTLYTVNTGGRIDPDAIGYDEMGRYFRLSKFYHASYREPFPIFAINLHYKILNSLGLYEAWRGRNYLPLRSFSVVYSSLVILMTYLLAGRLISKKIGTISATLVSANHLLIYNSTRGLVTEFYMFFVLLFFYLLFAEKKMSINKKFISLGILGGLLLLTRSSIPYLMLLSLLYAALENKQYRSVKIALPVLLAIVIAFPFYFNCKKKYGEFNYITILNAIWWKNCEFRDQVGHIRFEEFEKNPCQGERITPFDYFFRYHTPLEVIKRNLQGFRYSFSHRLFMFDPLIMPLMVIGLFLLLFYKYTSVTVMWILMTLPYSFILTLNAEERYTYEAYPLLAIAVAFALVSSSRIFIPYLERLSYE